MNAIETLPVSLTGSKHAVLCGDAEREYTVYSFKSEEKAREKFNAYVKGIGCSAVLWVNGQLAGFDHGNGSGFMFA